MAHPTGGKWTEFITSEVALRNVNKPSLAIKDNSAQLPLQMLGDEAQKFYSEVLSTCESQKIQQMVELSGDDSEDEVKIICRNKIRKRKRRSSRSKTSDNNDCIIILHDGSDNCKPMENNDDISLWCSVCQESYNNDKESHENSIIHHFNASSSLAAGLTKSNFYIPQTNKGYQMMLSQGWDRISGLGPEGIGPKYPVKTILKLDRSGLGKEELIPKVTHFNPNDPKAILSNKQRRKENCSNTALLSKGERKAILSQSKQRELDIRKEVYES